jgi:hypothetical protein
VLRPTPTALIAGSLAFILAVPGGCVREPIHYGSLTIINRTLDPLVVHAEYASEQEMVVQPCDTLTRDDFPLNAVTVDAMDDRGEQHPSIQHGVETGDILILAIAGQIDAVERAPTPLPNCTGHL